MRFHSSSIVSLIMTLSSAGLVAGCATAIPTTVDVPGMPNAEVALRESFARVDAETSKLGTMQAPPHIVSKSTPPEKRETPAPIRPRHEGPVMANHRGVVPAELQRLVSFDFNGSLDDGVGKLAETVGYTLAVRSIANEQPKPIVIPASDAPVIDYLQAIGTAMGDRATVEVDTLHRQIVVIHHV